MIMLFIRSHSVHTGNLLHVLAEIKPVSKGSF